MMTGSNRRPSACKADALPAELITLASLSLRGAFSHTYCVSGCFYSVFLKTFKNDLFQRPALGFLSKLLNLSLSRKTPR
ncbi:hypothetical protein PLUA15_470081 [Pseudomonas lundensis]|uniref:Uncharacterized protein n=1 Tax=Pseudomonas lundensis TaxID=86185 RepID=A0AAX2HAT7_9PSED|nr:hypothetical protein PLUA15_470081 [Pseudomonas lundensis]